MLSGKALTEEVSGFCENVFGGGGAVLAGPGGSRFVYDLRPRFDLFCKLSPLRPVPALQEAGRLKGSSVEGADILVVRENTGGEYLGEWDGSSTPSADGSAATPFTTPRSTSAASSRWRPSSPRRGARSSRS